MSIQLEITTSNHIILDGEQTNYRILQARGETIVYDGGHDNSPYDVSRRHITLPHRQYSTAWDGVTLAGNPGREQFYRDVKAAISAHEKASA